MYSTSWSNAPATAASPSAPATRSLPTSRPKASSPWPKPLKELCKNGKRVNLERLFAVTTAELTPNDSAYAMALFAFMNSTPEKTTAFNKLLEQIKESGNPSPQDMADIFGFATPGEFEEAWYAYIMSSKFK